MKWKEILGKVAPTLVKAAGGSLGGLAVSVLTSALGIEPNEDALEKKVATLTADDLLKLKEAENKFVLDMRKLDLDFDKIDIEDRANARAREIALKDWMPKALGITVIILYACTIAALMFLKIPEPNRDMMNQMAEILKMAVIMILSYYFGSSAGSRAKDSPLHKK